MNIRHTLCLGLILAGMACLALPRAGRAQADPPVPPPGPGLDYPEVPPEMPPDQPPVPEEDPDLPDLPDQTPDLSQQIPEEPETPAEASPNPQPTRPSPAQPPAAQPKPEAPAPTAVSTPMPPMRRIPQIEEGAGLRLNFQNAPLSEVLNYMSEAAGFVIVQEKPIEGAINVVSHQPLSPDEALDLLNTILVEKGYVALRSGRILKIVARDRAHLFDLPVRSGADPEQIPKRDEMVTQIIPVRYGDAVKLMENLQPLLGEQTTMTANESSNAIILTDTLTNIRRVAEIIQALDTSIAGISTVRVFPLQYADATQLATVVKELFSSTGTSSSQRNRDRGGGPPEFFRMRGGDNGRSGSSSNSEARQASARVVAVADERSNSLVVGAPDELMPTIEELVKEMDTSVTDLTELRVFRLQNADAMELADLVTELFEEDSTSSNNRNMAGGFRPPWMPPQGGNSGNSSSRSLVQGKVVAVGDRRTNSLLVSAPRQMMSHVAEMVGRLDASTDKKQQVFVYPLEHADVDNVATILRGMFEDSGTSGRSATGTQSANPLADRSATGASSDIMNSFGGRSGNR